MYFEGLVVLEKYVKQDFIFYLFGNLEIENSVYINVIELFKTAFVV